MVYTFFFWEPYINGFTKSGFSIYVYNLYIIKYLKKKKTTNGIGIHYS